MKFRHEYKCRINLHDMIWLRSRFNQIMQHDQYATDSGKYLIKSLYFDNYMDKALFEKETGVCTREKFRIRYYNDDISFMRLEKKYKRNFLTSKTSEIITADECRDIMYGVKKSVFDTDKDLVREFYAKQNYQMLRPKNIVAYTREAFVYVPGNVRVTFDSDICGSNNVYGFLDAATPLVSLFPFVIMEIKWDEYIPQVIKDIVQTNKNSISSFSKYASTRFF